MSSPAPLRKPKPFVIGITGGIGCGKSTVAALFREWGLEVLDADAMSHALTAAGGAAVDEVALAFGEDMRASDGGIDRRKLAALVFRDKNAIDRLSSIIHRHVIAGLINGVADAGRRGLGAICLDVPIPVREGFLDLTDYVVVVWASEDVRLERLAARGMEPAEARRRIRMQMTEEEYSSLASTVLRNDGDKDELRELVDGIVRDQLHARGIRLLRAEPVGGAADLGDQGDIQGDDVDHRPLK
ncbi:MAG: dephospho-CoA kinase [Bacillota bacterium]|nr:dephospho-CoA kinase [Bacillota bacterium]